METGLAPADAAAEEPQQASPGVVARALAAVRPVAGVFLWSRATIWLIALFSLLVFEPNRSLSPVTSASLDPSLTTDLGYWTDVWAHWDSVWFLQIAHHAYGVSPQASAFYPLYPALVALFARALFFGHYVLAGIFVSLTSTLAAFAMLWSIGRERLGAEGAQRAVVYLAVFPMALFLGAVYSEGLLLALVLAAFMCAERGLWLPAWVLTGLAMLTKVGGWAVLPALLLLAWRAPDRRRALIGAPLAPALFAIFPIVLWRMTGDWLAFAHAEKEVWHRHLAMLGPLTGLWDGTKAGIVGLGRVLSQQPVQGRSYAIGRDYTLFTAAFNVQALVFLVLFLFLTVVAWRRFGSVYGLFCAVSLAIPLATPNSGGWPLLSLPRFGLTVFPFFLALAWLGERPRLNTAIVAISAAWLGLAIVQWSLWEWMG